MHGQRMSTRWPEPLTLQPCCALYRANDRNCPVKIRTPALDKRAAWPPINEMARCALVAAQRSRLSRTCERLKLALYRLGYHRSILARLEKMSASEVYATVESQAVFLLLDLWERADSACRVS
jgi:hypothetical protein